MTPHDDMMATWKKDPTFRQEYDALAEEFALFDALVSARQQAGLTQIEVAERMGTKTPAVARLESRWGASAPCALHGDVAEVCRRSGVPFGGHTCSPVHLASTRGREAQRAQTTEAEAVPLPSPVKRAQPNIGLQATANSLRSSLAPAIGGA